MADEIVESETQTDYSKLKVNDLKKILKTRGLSTVGNKGELVERLTKSQSEETPDELLDGIGGGDSEVDDLEVEDLDESALMSDEKEISQSNKRKAGETENDKTEEEPPTKTKKVVLNRKTEVPDVPEEESSKEEGEEVDEKTDATNGKADSAEKSAVASESSRIIKISELTTKDKLQLRSQKFGLSESAKKELRAARFGIPTKTVMTEALKKRAERFGIKEITAPSAVKKTDTEDKLLARKNKFSAVTTPTPKTTITSTALDEKKLLRAQRFKLAT